VMNLLPGAALNIHRLYPVKCLGQLSMVTESDPESSETIDNSLCMLPTLENTNTICSIPDR
jgi:hypothetical protein